MPSASPKFFNFNQDHPSKGWFFWSNVYKIEVMITSLIEMLELSNLATLPHLQYNLSHVIKFCW